MCPHTLSCLPFSFCPLSSSLLLSATHCHQSASVTGPTEWTGDGPVSRSLCLSCKSDGTPPRPLLVDQVFLEMAPLRWAINTAFMWGRGKAYGKLVQNYKSRVPVASRSVGWLPGELPLLWQFPCLSALVSVLALLDHTCWCPCLC